MAGALQAAAAAPAGPALLQPCMQNVRNSDDAPQNEVHTKLKLGQSNQDSIYFRSWQQIQSVTAAKYSNAFWDMPTITEPMKVNLLKGKYERLWNIKLAFMFNMPYLNGEPIVTRKGVCMQVCAIARTAWYNFVSGCVVTEVSAAHWRCCLRWEVQPSRLAIYCLDGRSLEASLSWYLPQSTPF